MTPEEYTIEEKAFAFIKANAALLRTRFADPAKYKSVERPVSLFMAGSPGAGKTEVSKSLVKKFQSAPIRIDADEIRILCPGYTGSNSHLFQKAANKGVNILFDYALGHGISCILDGTFAYGGAVENIRRSIDKSRVVELWFIYQDPLKAWEFTKAREAKEARHVSKEVFIESFFEAKRNVRKVKTQFYTVELNLLIKDYGTSREDFWLNINPDELDRYIHDGYTEDTLQRLLI